MTTNFHGPSSHCQIIYWQHHEALHDAAVANTNALPYVHSIDLWCTGTLVFNHAVHKVYLVASAIIWSHLIDITDVFEVKAH